MGRLMSCVFKCEFAPEGAHINKESNLVDSGEYSSDHL